MSSVLKTRYVYEGVVESVYDADSWTISLDLGCHVTLSGEKVRLHGIDAAELRGPERDRGREAKAHVEELLDHYSLSDHERRFAFRTHPGKGREKGKYGRLLIVCYGRDPDTGVPVNLNRRFLLHRYILEADYG
jgi:endonuclease YncB( thermonuclease family)